MNKVELEILNIVKHYLEKDYSFDVYCDMEELLKTSNQLCLSPIVGYALTKNTKYKKNIFEELLYLSIIKQAKQNDLRQKVINIFNKNNINFIFLKGTSLSKYYDEDFLRLSSDVDVIVEKDNYEKAKNLLLTKKFKIVSSSKNETDLMYKNGAHLDLHSMFTHNETEIEELFKDVDFDDENNELSDEYKYIFSIYHAAKHLKKSYISFQFLIDLYYLSKLNIDKVFIDNKLKSMNLKTFEEKTIELINVLFNGKKSNKIVDEYLEFLLNVSKSQGLDNMALVGQGHSGGRLNHILSRAFPPFDEMCRMYPELKNNRILLPIYYVRRFIDRLHEGKYKRMLNEVNANLNVDKQKVQKTKELFDKLGL